jgi:hypothetical protein
MTPVSSSPGIGHLPFGSGTRQLHFIDHAAACQDGWRIRDRVGQVDRRALCRGESLVHGLGYSPDAKTLAAPRIGLGPVWATLPGDPEEEDSGT